MAGCGYGASERGAGLRVALVGFGRWGVNVARDLCAAGGAELTHIVDVDGGARDRAAAAHPRATVTPSLAEALEGVDAVAICTPAESHVDIASASLGRSRHVFVEKPFSMDLASAEALDELARRQSRVAMVGHQMLYHPSFERLVGAAVGGGLGALVEIRAERRGIVDPARDPGVLWAYGPHDVAMTIALAGEAPLSVRSVRGDGVSLRLEFAGGVSGTIVLDGDSRRRVRRFTAICERGEVVFEDEGAGRCIVRSKASRVPTETVHPNDGGARPLARELEDFVACCGSGASPRTSSAHAVTVTGVLEGAQREGSF